MATDPDCLFCKIVAGEIAADIVSESDHTVAFRDINPQAEMHVLVVPRVHQPNIAELAAADPDAAVALLIETQRVASEQGSGAYHLLFNNGSEAMQTVFHCHGHVLTGGTLAGLVG